MATASIVAAAPVEASAAAPRFVAPPVPPGADAEEVRLLSSICAVAHRPSAGARTAVGCRSHPPFDRPEQQPDGKLPLHEGDPMRLCQISKLYKGSFSRPGASEVVIAFDACFEQGDQFETNYFNSESVVLAEETPGALKPWSATAYEATMHASACSTSRRKDGRDALLCRSGIAAQGAGEITFFFLLDFARTQKRAGTVAWLYSDLFDCAAYERDSYRLAHGFVAIEIGDEKLTDVNGDGTPDLVVDVKRARTPPSAALDKKVRDVCSRNPELGAKAIASPFKKVRLEIVSRGSSFEPSVATSKLLATWEAEAPPNMNGLKGAAPDPIAP